MFVFSSFSCLKSSDPNGRSFPDVQVVVEMSERLLLSNPTISTRHCRKKLWIYLISSEWNSSSITLIWTSTHKHIFLSLLFLNQWLMFVRRKRLSFVFSFCFCYFSKVTAGRVQSCCFIKLFPPALRVNTPACSSGRLILLHLSSPVWRRRPRHSLARCSLSLSLTHFQALHLSAAAPLNRSLCWRCRTLMLPHTFLCR